MNSRRESTGVSSKTIETVYREYKEGAYAVNRKYQRKLVWTVHEKQSLIESILNQYPLPQFLVAEDSSLQSFQYEIIDGMQRLNAIVAFIENEFDLGGKYFDLAALALTKEQLDSGKLKQQTPILDRDQSVRIATYEIAQSIFKTTNAASVEEVFRRINSTGQKLSRQDLRQAGSTSPIADVVREISSRIRGDASAEDIVPLSGMKSLSIASSQNPYGISPDTMFWVTQSILNRADVRTSGDEQLVLDIVADMVLKSLPSTGTPVRNALFQVADPKLSRTLEKQVEALLSDPAWMSGKKSEVVTEFMQTFDRIQRIFAEIPEGKSFAKHIGRTGNNPIPRYFEALFVAVWRQLYGRKMDLSNARLAANTLADTKAFSRMPGGGGEWEKDKKRKIIDALSSALEHAFDIPISAGHRPEGEEVLTRNEFDSIVSSVLLESSSRDMKQGLLRLDDGRRNRIDDSAFEKIVRTLTAISNTHPLTGGHVILGVADSAEHCDRIEALDGVSPLTYRGLKIVGVDREAPLLGDDLDKYWDRVIMKLADSRNVSTEYLREAARGSAVARFEDRTMFVLAAPSVREAVKYGGDYYEREAARTVSVEDPMQFGMRFGRRLDRTRENV